MAAIRPIIKHLKTLPFGIANAVRRITPLSSPVADSLTISATNIMNPKKAAQMFHGVMDQMRMGEDKVDCGALRRLLTYVQDVSISSIQTAEQKLELRLAEDSNKILPESTFLDDSIRVTRTFRDAKPSEPQIQKFDYAIDIPVPAEMQFGQTYLTSKVCIRRDVSNGNELQRPFYNDYIKTNPIFPSISVTGDTPFYTVGERILSCFEAKRAIIEFNVGKRGFKSELQQAEVDFQEPKH